MAGSARKALMTSIALMVLRRRLQKRSGPTAALALVGLELFGPRVLQMRRVLTWLLALTVIGCVVLVGLWWWRRQPRPRPAAGTDWSAPLAPEAPADWAPAAETA